MTKKVTFRWKISGFQQIRRLPGVKERLATEAQIIATLAGEGYETAMGEGRTRSRAVVYTATRAARKSDYENNTLSRILASRRKAR